MQLLHVLDDVLATRRSDAGMELCLKQASSSSPQKKSAEAAASFTAEDYDLPDRSQEQIFSFPRDVFCKVFSKGMQPGLLDPTPPPPPTSPPLYSWAGSVVYKGQLLPLAFGDFPSFSHGNSSGTPSASSPAGD